MSLQIWLYFVLSKFSVCLGGKSWRLWSYGRSLYTNTRLYGFKWHNNVWTYIYIDYNIDEIIIQVVIWFVYWTWWCSVWAASALFTTFSKEKRKSHTTRGMNTHSEDLLTKCFHRSAICTQRGCFYQNVQCPLHSRVWMEIIGRWLQLAWKSDGGQLCCHRRGV